MKALILNSGLGSRMGELTEKYPKCMTELMNGETIISRQLNLLSETEIRKVIITTGAFESELKKYILSLKLPLEYHFVYNPEYASTNYIYSIYLARKFLSDDLLFFHGDLVFERRVLEVMMEFQGSAMAVSTTSDLPGKDFKAVIQKDFIQKVGIEFFENAYAAQPLYKFQRNDWERWLDKIIEFCESGKRCCYAEKALNEVAEKGFLKMCDIKELLCSEIDTLEDRTKVLEALNQKDKSVYMCFSADLIHSGHLELIKKAQRLGKLTVGILTDEAVASYKRYPLVPFEERKALFENIAGIKRVIKQDTLSYASVLKQEKPDYVVHGDNWKEGFQKTIREEVLRVLNTYGGQLIEYPYSKELKYKQLDERIRSELSLPDIRRGRLKNIISMKGCINAIEAHSGLTGLIAEKTIIEQDGKAYQFDAMWVSSLCDSTAKGKPDIELVDMTSRFRTIDDIMEVTTKPIIFDGDTGGLTEHFVYTVKTLERMGVSAVIIEDKTGLKKNSLFGTETEQTQDSIENFSEKIRAGKKAQKSKDFMIIARIESLILERGMEDALKRAFAFAKAGADGIMIHSRQKEPTEIFEFIEKFRCQDPFTPLVVVPTTFNSVREEEFKSRGVNVVIYANQLTRSAFPAMKHIAETILRNHRAKEADELCMPFKEIIRLIPDKE